MLLSQLLGERYKEKPSDATLASYIYLLRGGYIRQVSNGIFSLLPPAKRVSRRLKKNHTGRNGPRGRTGSTVPRGASR